MANGEKSSKTWMQVTLWALATFGAISGGGSAITRETSGGGVTETMLQHLRRSMEHERKVEINAAIATYTETLGRDIGKLYAITDKLQERSAFASVQFATFGADLTYIKDALGKIEKKLDNR